MSKRSATELRESLAPIDRSGITELVVERIKELLARGELRAGSRLPPERELAGMLSISRPSLRTALKALSVMGIIRAKPGAGTYIAESLPEIFNEPMHFMTLIHNISDEELFEARRIIESGLAGLAAERATEDDLSVLSREIEGMHERLDDPEGFLKHDVAFHQTIAQAADNTVMTGVMETIAQLLYHIRRQSIADADDLDEALRWHERIYAAIRSRDAAQARETISAHLRAAEAGWAKQKKLRDSARVTKLVPRAAKVVKRRTPPADD
jgi:GntR family transcriptional repressor for pyruvate dehydrogenase complex